MNKKYWIAAREYSGLAEAGGVKNVVTSLAHGFSKIGWDVTVFIPLYGCTDFKYIKGFRLLDTIAVDFTIDSKLFKIKFCKGYFDGVQIIFIINSIFTQKLGVYTYTKLEEAMFSDFKSGTGHIDSSIMSVVFQKAVVEYGKIANEYPDIFHCQDAHTALIPFLVHSKDSLQEHYKYSKFFVTIHNAGDAYRCQIGSVYEASMLLGLPEETFSNYTINNTVEPFLLSQKYAQFTTVSPWYAEELLDNTQLDNSIISEFMNRKFPITGITNGIDYELYNPKDKDASKLPFTYNPLIGDLQGKYDCRKLFLDTYNVVNVDTETKKIDKIYQHGVLFDKINSTDDDSVYFVFHGRLVHQKGVDVLAKAAKIVLEQRSNARFVIMGHGDSLFEQEHSNLAQDNYGKYIYFKGYDKALSRLVIAMGDFIVLPSFFEPCGLEDFIGQILGTIPVAHACGGLKKIIHGKTGYLYHKNTPELLAKILIELVDFKQKNTLHDMIQYSANYVKNEYSWVSIINDQYMPLFQ